VEYCILLFNLWFVFFGGRGMDMSEGIAERRTGGGGGGGGGGC
jgi:hypothetical protein